MTTRYDTMAGPDVRWKRSLNIINRTVTGGRGIQLHVVDGGNPQRRPILFIHGFSQCSLTWARQMHSDLANDYRLVSMDMRGHGLSEKPRDAYDQPELCGWSYGALLILDYIRHHGEDAIDGINLVGTVTPHVRQALLSRSFDNDAATFNQHLRTFCEGL